MQRKDIGSPDGITLNDNYYDQLKFVIILNANRAKIPNQGAAKFI